ncbi:MAG: hypothetical protein R3B84_06560 [Zavarzinella sp.]
MYSNEPVNSLVVENWLKELSVGSDSSNDKLAEVSRNQIKLHFSSKYIRQLQELFVSSVQQADTAKR